jgi:hypothetical protein
MLSHDLCIGQVTYDNMVEFMRENLCFSRSHAMRKVLFFVLAHGQDSMIHKETLVMKMMIMTSITLNALESHWR